MKVKLTVEKVVDLPITSKEAGRAYPDCLWPVEAYALDKVTETGISNLVAMSETVIDAVILDE